VHRVYRPASNRISFIFIKRPTKQTTKEFSFEQQQAKRTYDLRGLSRDSPHGALLPDPGRQTLLADDAGDLSHEVFLQVAVAA